MDTGFLSMARKAKTSAEFGIVISELEKSIADTSSRRIALQDEIEGAVFGRGDVAKLRQAITDAAGDLETMQAALNGARKRHAEALLVEQKRAQDEDVARRDEQAKLLVEKLRKFQDAIGAARAALAEMDPEKRKLDGLNEALPEYRRISVKGLQIRQRETDDKINPKLSRTNRALDEILRDCGTPFKSISMTRRPSMFNKPSGSLEGIAPAGTIAG